MMTITPPGQRDTLQRGAGSSLSCDLPALVTQHTLQHSTTRCNTAHIATQHNTLQHSTHCNVAQATRCLATCRRSQPRSPAARNRAAGTGRRVVVCRTLYAARCMLHYARCMFHDACCTLHDACCTMHAARCTLHSCSGKAADDEDGAVAAATSSAPVPYATAPPTPYIAYLRQGCKATVTDHEAPPFPPKPPTHAPLLLSAARCARAASAALDAF